LKFSLFSYVSRVEFKGANLEHQLLLIAVIFLNATS